MSAPKKLTIGRGIHSRLTKAGVAADARFDALVNAYLESLGARIQHPLDSPYPSRWHLETKAGALGVTSYGHWIACRFEYPARAKAFVGTFGLNEYSGKWNHHYDVGAGEREIEDFKRQLRRVLIDGAERDGRPEGAP